VGCGVVFFVFTGRGKIRFRSAGAPSRYAGRGGHPANTGTTPGVPQAITSGMSECLVRLRHLVEVLLALTVAPTPFEASRISLASLSAIVRSRRWRE